jgi:hypothetical protein
MQSEEAREDVSRVALLVLVEGDGEERTAQGEAVKAGNSVESEV